MNLRYGISIALGSICMLTTHAQTQPEDSLRQRKITKKEAEIYINPEAVKSIQFDFLGTPEPEYAKPMMSQDKPYMKFRKDLPQHFTDTTQRHPSKRIAVSPYHPSPLLRESLFQLPKDSLIMRMKLNLEKISVPGSGASFSFDANKLLYENFTKRGRAIKRNRKRAKAWKTYENYVPTKEDHRHLQKKQDE